MYVEAEISTGEDGVERLIDTLSLIGKFLLNSTISLDWLSSIRLGYVVRARLVLTASPQAFDVYFTQEPFWLLPILMTEIGVVVG